MDILNWKKKGEGVAGSLLGISFFFLILIGLSPSVDSALAGEQVSAKYVVAADGNEVVVRLELGLSPPATLMVIQNIPPGARLTESQPEAKTIDSEKQEAKWLLLGVRPGVETVRMLFDRKVGRDELRGEVRYRVPETGKMESLLIAK